MSSMAVPRNSPSMVSKCLHRITQLTFICWFQSRCFLSGNTCLFKALHPVEAPTTHHGLILDHVRARKELGKLYLPHPMANLETRKVRIRDLQKVIHSQGVVSICSPVKIAFAPAMKHIACSGSARVFLPAARRMMVVGKTIRAVAIVRTKVWYGTG